MVIYVVKNASRSVFGEDSPMPDRKRFAFLCGVYCNSEAGVMQVVSAQTAAQMLSRNRQRIASRIYLLEIELTLQKYYFGLNLVSPQKLLHSRNLSGILRESMFEIRESTCSYEQMPFTQPYPKKYCFISEVPPSLSQNHS